MKTWEIAQNLLANKTCWNCFRICESKNETCKNWLGADEEMIGYDDKIKADVLDELARIKKHTY
jgi:hypothetical protein